MSEKYPVKCIVCNHESQTTDKETSTMNRWICWGCIERIKEERKYVKAILDTE